MKHDCWHRDAMFSIHITLHPHAVFLLHKMLCILYTKKGNFFVCYFFSFVSGVTIFMGPFKRGLFHDNYSIGIHIEETPFYFFLSQILSHQSGKLGYYLSISFSDFQGKTL